MTGGGRAMNDDARLGVENDVNEDATSWKN
jgi:hypothetical protein